MDNSITTTPATASKQVVLFPMNRTESGNLVMQAFDATTLSGTLLVFIDALRARMLGISTQVDALWVEAKKEGVDYGDFCAENSITIDNVKLAAYIQQDGQPWTTEGDEPKPWYGLVQVPTA